MSCLRIVYFMAVSLTAGVFINERKQGLLDRCLVAGTPNWILKDYELINFNYISQGLKWLKFCLVN